MSFLEALSGGGTNIKIRGNFANEAQILCCIGPGAQVDSRRYVYNAGTETLEEKKPGLFKRLCCCCCGQKKEKGTPAENKQAIKMFEVWLAQNYPSVAAQAPSFAHIDLQSRLEEGKPLRAKHLRQITLAARTIQDTAPQVKSSLYALQMGEDVAQACKSKEEEDTYPQRDEFEKFVKAVLKVCVEDDTKNEFTDSDSGLFSGRAVNQWVKENVLCSYTFAWNVEIANEFIARVKYAIIQLKKETLTTAEVKKIIFQQFRIMGIRVTTPSFISEIPEETVRSLRTKVDPSSLSGGELEALIKALQTQAKV